jgi:Protein of unknown function (DUF1360)
VTLSLSHSVWLVWTVYALAVYRATRLVTTDEITEPFRRRIQSRGWREQVRLDARDVVIETRTIDAPGARGALARWTFSLVTCNWCVSMWVAGGVLMLALHQAAWFFWLALVGCWSAIAGVISERV